MTVHELLDNPKFLMSSKEKKREFYLGLNDKNKEMFKDGVKTHPTGAGILDALGDLLGEEKHPRYVEGEGINQVPGPLTDLILGQAMFAGVPGKAINLGLSSSPLIEDISSGNKPSKSSLVQAGLGVAFNKFISKSGGMGLPKIFGESEKEKGLRTARDRVFKIGEKLRRLEIPMPKPTKILKNEESFKYPINNSEVTDKKEIFKSLTYGTTTGTD